MPEVNYLGYAQLMGQRNPTAEGLATLGQSLDQLQATDRQRKMDAMTMEQNRRAASLADLQMQQSGLNLAQDRAGSLAMIGQYGTGDRPDFQTQLADATAFKAQEERMAAAAQKEAEETQRYFQTVKMMKEAGATPESITSFSKVALKANPKYASIADTVSYMDDTKMVIARDVKEREIPDPTRPGQFLPAGKYELEGVATGNPANPYKFNKIVPAKGSDKEAWSEPYMDTVGGKKVMLQKSSTGQIKPVVQDVSTTVKVNAGNQDKADMYEKRAAFGELPKLRQDAMSAQNAMPRINRMLNILDKGNAGGITSTIKAIVAPYAPEAESANEAALFKIYARLVSGPQRVNIIGPGPQTEKEGDLLALVGGGGTQGRAALRELLAMHKDGYVSKINEYNGMIESAGTKIYKPIDLGGGSPKAPSTSPNRGPKVGTVEGGYRFKGGNPADQKNWVKVR